MAERIALRIPANEKAELENYAKNLNISVSRLVRQATPAYAEWLLKQKELATFN